VCASSMLHNDVLYDILKLYADAVSLYVQNGTSTVSVPSSALAMLKISLKLTARLPIMSAPSPQVKIKTHHAIEACRIVSSLQKAMPESGMSFV